MPKCVQFERRQLLSHALQLLFADAVEIGVDHGPSRAELLAGKAATRGRKLLLIDDGMRMIALAGFLRIAGVESALIFARATVEERAECERNDPAEVENAGEDL